MVRPGQVWQDVIGCGVVGSGEARQASLCGLFIGSNLNALNPFWNRPELEKLYTPLVGTSMLELGGKQDAGRIYKPYFESLGFRHVSVDIDPEEVRKYGALPLDLTKPLNLGTFSMVCNIGTSEHVAENDFKGQIECWRNIVEALHVGSVLICDTPHPGMWKGHGTWYPTERFYSELAKLNGLEVERLLVNRWRPEHQSRKVVSARMVKRRDVPFQMPLGCMYHNNEGRYF